MRTSPSHRPPLNHTRRRGGRHRAITAGAFAAGAFIVGSFSPVGLAAVGGTASNSIANAAQPAPTVKLTKVATAENPVLVLAEPGTGDLYVVEQPGRLRALMADASEVAAFDVSDSVSTGNEQGLLGAAFSPDGKWLYTNHTNRNGDTEITATPWANGEADQSKTVLLLKVSQPYSNHNGGNLIVDSKGVLWIGLGDGGSAGDPQSRAQNLKVLLGKMLRILPTPGRGKTSPYSIPAGNIPKSVGRPEIWGYGLRNPWRFSIDAPTNTLWIGDVGQNEVEEIDAVSVKAVRPNFGWRRREGNTTYSGKAFKAGEAVEPVWTYKHSSGGCSVTGGLVYRGTAIPALRGRYIYTDFCDSTVRVLDDQFKSSSLGVSGEQLSSFGVDSAGEVYITSLEGDIFRLDRR